MIDESMSAYFRRQALDGMEAWYPAHEGELVKGEEFERRAEIVALLIRCRETITAGNPSLSPLDEFVERKRELAEDWLDSCYTCDQLWAVPDMVKRTLKFSKLVATTIPSDQTALYIIEANRSYIQGFFLSSVAMARCALEQALKERLAAFIDRREPDPTLRGLIELAEEEKFVLSPTSIPLARKLARKCNKVMHQRPVHGEEAAFEILVGIRGLIIEIYSSEA